MCMVSREVMCRTHGKHEHSAQAVLGGHTATRCVPTCAGITYFPNRFGGSV